MKEIFSTKSTWPDINTYFKSICIWLLAGSYDYAAWNYIFLNKFKALSILWVKTVSSPRSSYIYFIGGKMKSRVTPLSKWVMIWWNASRVWAKGWLASITKILVLPFAEFWPLASVFFQFLRSVLQYH